MHRFKSFLLISIALWLPVQAASAVVMPFCRHATDRAGQVAAMPGVEHCREQAAAAADTADNPLGCDNCEMCHLATAGYLPAPAAPPMPAAASVLVALPTPALPSHIGAPPQQPPRRPN
jgi:hypothetical protein